jgi:hypothetical protein
MDERRYRVHCIITTPCPAEEFRVILGRFISARCRYLSSVHG